MAANGLLRPHVFDHPNDAAVQLCDGCEDMMGSRAADLGQAWRIRGTWR